MVADIDDAYPILPWSNPAHEFWINDPNKINPIKMLEDGIKLCGYLTSPNRFILTGLVTCKQGLSFT